MRLVLSTLVLGFGLLLAPLAVASTEGATALLKRFGTQGEPPSVIALQQLQQPAHVPAGNAPLSTRRRYQYALASHAIALKQEEVARAARQAIASMAQGEGCAACSVDLDLLEALAAAGNKQGDRARALLASIEPRLSDDPELLLEFHLQRAAAMDMAGDLGPAIESGLRAEQIAARLERPGVQTRAINSLVLSNIARQDFARALALAKEGYAIAERIGDTVGMIRLRGNQAVAYGHLGEQEQQRRVLTDILKLTEGQRGFERDHMVTLVNLSQLSGSLQRHAEALEYGRMAAAMAHRLGDPLAEGVAILNAAAGMYGLGQREEGIAHLRTGIALVERAGAKGYLVGMYRSLAGMLAEAGQPREALAALYKLLELRDAVMQEEREKAVLDLQERYSAERKSREIERLSLENARRQAERTAWAAAAVASLLGGVMLLQWLARIRRRNRVLEVDNASLTQQSIHDPLTGAFNRRHCQRLMSQQEAALGNGRRHRDYRASIGLMLLDVDFFKKVNDTYGHAAGDAVLVEVARRLQGLVREEDAVVRWGGEEFVLVLPGTSADGLAAVAQRVLDTIGHAPVATPGATIPITLSAGCIAWPAFAGQGSDDAMHMADVALYIAKSTGRNRAVCLLDIREGADLDGVRDDLAAASASGEVRLLTVEGPCRTTADESRIHAPA